MSAERINILIDNELDAQLTAAISDVLEGHDHLEVNRFTLAGHAEDLLTDTPTLLICGSDRIEQVLVNYAEGNRLRFIGIGPRRGALPVNGRWVELEPETSIGKRILQAFVDQFSQLQVEASNGALLERVNSLEGHLRELNTIGMSLSSQQDLDALLEMILSKAREITCSDSGSLYLIETDQSGNSYIRFKLAQNHSREFEFSEFTLPINKKSVVGYVALKGESYVIDDVYHISASEEFLHNPDFDRRNDYRTKSMLVVPMINQKGSVIGVLQLINKKNKFQTILNNDEASVANILEFTSTDLELVESLASQACVSIENARLYQDIQRLFEGFIQASVLAIESRDPTTSGHSNRVAQLTCGLAEVVDKESGGRFNDVAFSEQDMRELRYASLLHDFGKIGVREEVLVKAKKLYPHEITIINSRFQMIRSLIERDLSKKKIEYLLERSRDEVAAELKQVDADLEKRLKEIDNHWKFVLDSAQPTVLEEGAFDYLHEIADKTYVDSLGEEQPFLTENEVKFLSIRKGSLSKEERLAIESHVTHSYNFLKQIPWTQELRRIPDIAFAHHEKLNGSGYPRKLTAPDIPLQTKIMTIADIFDALSARDRPYKKAVPVARALDILKMEVDDGCLDPDLYTLFVDAKVFQLVIDD